MGCGSISAKLALTAEVVMAVYVLCVVLTPDCTVGEASACGTHQPADGLSAALFQYKCTAVGHVYSAWCSGTETGNMNMSLGASVIGRLIIKSSSPERCGIGRLGRPGACSICCA